MVEESNSHTPQLTCHHCVGYCHCPLGRTEISQRKKTRFRTVAQRVLARFSNEILHGNIQRTPWQALQPSWTIMSTSLSPEVSKLKEELTKVTSWYSPRLVLSPVLNRYVLLNPMKVPGVVEVSYSRAHNQSSHTKYPLKSKEKEYS